jgi:hypothetical protein
VFEELTPSKERAIRAYAIFSVLFFIVAIGTGFILAHDRGFGTGPWNTDTTYSCYARGGPQYLPDVPISKQPCPSTKDAGLIARAPR